MAELKKEMKVIHDKTDFKIDFAGTTQLGEFRYTHGGSVQPGLEYHIHYTNDKEEVFMTGGVHNPSSKIIEKVREDNHGKNSASPSQSNARNRKANGRDDQEYGLSSQQLLNNVTLAGTCRGFCKFGPYSEFH